MSIRSHKRYLVLGRSPKEVRTDYCNRPFHSGLVFSRHLDNNKLVSISSLCVPYSYINVDEFDSVEVLHSTVVNNLGFLGYL